MMGKFLAFCGMFAIASAASAEYYNVTVKTVADKTAYPDAVFRMEPGGSQMKGFEATIDAVGFGAEGVKTFALIEREQREKITKKMEKELSVPAAEKLDNELDRLETEMRRLEKLAGRAVGAAAEGKPSIPGSRGFGKRGPTPPPDNSAYKNTAAYQKAAAEYEKFKASYDRAKRNMNIQKELVSALDEKVKKYYKRMLSTALIPSGTYPYGTFCAIDLKKVSDKAALVDFEYAVSRILGFTDPEGNNNGNSMNCSLDIEYVEMPKAEGVVIELGKPYCFQIARPEKQGGSLSAARNATSIFAEDNVSKTIEAGTPSQPARKKSPLDASGDYAKIRSKFKGDERKVVRVVVTISKAE